MGTNKGKGNRPENQPKKEQGPPTDVQSAIRRLSEMLDLVYFMGYIGRKTSYGKKPHADPWGYTRQMLAGRKSKIPIDEVVRAFGEVGVENEVKAAEWIVVNDKHIR